MENYSIKSISTNDLEQCVEVIRKGFGTVAKDFGLTIENCATNGAFIKVERLIADKEKGNLMYGLFVDEKMVGFMQLEKKSIEKYILEKFTVLPEYRHCGYGKSLLEFACNKVKELGGKKILIGIIEENKVLKQWYTTNGFIHVGTREFDTLPFTVGFMEKEINL